MPHKTVTSLDVAKHAGVSRATVSFVLNNVPNIQISPETVQRVLNSAKELGYEPNEMARALVSRRSHSFALILSRSSDRISSDMFLNLVVVGLLNVAHQNKMRLIIDVIEDYDEKGIFMSLIKGKRVDGIILNGPRFDDKALDYLLENKFPTVVMGHFPNPNFCSVDVDNVKAARMAVEHLTRLGYQRIACITNAPASFMATLDRLEGYKQALAASNLPFSEDMVRYGNFGPESGYTQMLSLIDDPHFKMPAAVFIASDVVAFGAIRAIHERGLKIPQDIAIVGFDDVPMSSYITPPLTTVRLPAMELADRAGALLLNQIQNKQENPCQELLDTELVIRQSCGSKSTTGVTR